MNETDTLRDEYDFSQGKPNPYYLHATEEHSVRIHHEDGTMTSSMLPMAYFLDDDLIPYFPDSKSLNDTLRALLALFPEKKIVCLED